jgi:membrane-associated protein
MFGFDLNALAQTAGYVGIFAIIFAESGLFFGFFLPGDSFLFTVGLLASLGHFNIFILIPLLATAAILGDNVGYASGKFAGPKLFTRPESFWFNPKHIHHTQTYFKNHGPKTIVLARFIPIVRTFAPILAGASKMNYKIFFFYNVLGGLLWSVGITLFGYLLGSIIPNIDQYLMPIIVGIIAVSFVPVLREAFKKK